MATKKSTRKKKQPAGLRIVGKIIELVDQAEKRFPRSAESSRGKEKKEWLTTELNKYIDIPVVGEGTERIVVGLLVEVAVDFRSRLQDGKRVDPHTLSAELANEFVDLFSDPEIVRDLDEDIEALLEEMGIKGQAAEFVSDAIIWLSKQGFKLWANQAARAKRRKARADARAKKAAEREKAKAAAAKKKAAAKPKTAAKKSTAAKKTTARKSKTTTARKTKRKPAAPSKKTASKSKTTAPRAKKPAARKSSGTKTKSTPKAKTAPKVKGTTKPAEKPASTGSK